MAIMPRPRGGDWLEDEIKLLQEEGVGILVSALTSEEVEELDLEMESDVCLQYGIAFQPFPISDRDVPSSYHAVHGFVKSLAQDLDAGKAIAIHCRAGIGRSSLLAASVLIVRGFSPTAA